jgi:hypothetical protein
MKENIMKRISLIFAIALVALCGNVFSYIEGHGYWGSVSEIRMFSDNMRAHYQSISSPASDALCSVNISGKDTKTGSNGEFTIYIKNDNAGKSLLALILYLKQNEKVASFYCTNNYIDYFAVN